MNFPIAYERSLDPDAQHDPPQVTQRRAALARIKAIALGVASGQPDRLPDVARAS